ncbi:MAG: DUF401 family protein [Candidatus Bathyarchaeota archaeon]|nr:MAG: DUF401 family protein [Candidatus Bathyarchaeota archaeon]
MGLLDPLLALLVSFVILLLLLHKRISIGLALFSSAIVMSLLSLSPIEVVDVFVATSIDPVTVSLVFVTFGIMVLTLFYKETGELDRLCRNFAGLVKYRKLVVSLLPAIIGLLPVPGGALMSAPIVEAETEKLELEEEKRTYLNIWFRHIIFPIYPMSQVLILAAALTGVSITSIILNQIPIVIMMTTIGYFTVLKPINFRNEGRKTSFANNFKNFVVSFSPILIMVLAVLIFRVDVFLAAFVGIALLLLITRFPMQVFIKILSNSTIYKITLAAFGAMLLRSVIINSGASGTLGQVIAAWGVADVLLLLALPSILAFLVGSSSGAIAISAPILTGILHFTSSNASLLYSSAYLGYLGAPTHLCLVLTADYFKCSLNRLYRLLIPSLVATFSVALLVYLLQ